MQIHEIISKNKRMSDFFSNQNRMSHAQYTNRKLEFCHANNLQPVARHSLKVFNLFLDGCHWIGRLFQRSERMIVTGNPLSTRSCGT